MTYRYQGRDLFAEPEGYNFADCAADSFLQGWKKYRAGRLEGLLGHADEGSAARDCADKGDADASSLVTLLAGIRDRLADGAGGEERDNACARLNKLVSKFEVFRRLFTHYDADLKKAPGAEPAGSRHYLLFAEVLVAFVAKNGEARVLSTLLKLVDALLTRAATEFSSEDCRRLAAVVEAEAYLVANWETAVSMPGDTAPLQVG